jgi:chemotaxis protein methyltransferase CheR
METQHLSERSLPAETLALLNSQLFKEIDDGRALAQAIVDTIREPLLVLDKDLRVVTASRSFYLTFKMERLDVQGRPVYALGDGEWNIPELRSLLEHIAPQHGVMEAYEVEREFSGIGRRTMLLNARKVFYEGNSHTTILLAIEDITARRSKEREQEPHAAAELEASRAREEALRQEARDLAQRQAMMAQEFEHRLINGLQVISSLLSLQSRAAKTPEAADQLTIAAARVAALGRVHRRLHLLDHQDRVEFKRYLEHLCEDLSRLLCEETGDCVILVGGANAEIPTVLAIPLGFIANELITNAVKYAGGDIAVRFETTASGRHSLSVSDGGPGLPAGFDPRGSKGLGMKIVAALVTQIGGKLHISSGDDGRGARFTVVFPSPRTAKPADR